MQKTCDPQNYIFYFQVESKVLWYGSDLRLDTEWRGEAEAYLSHIKMKGDGRGWSRDPQGNCPFETFQDVSFILCFSTFK